MEAKPNPELYQRLTEPFADKAEADTAVNDFLEEVGRLRELYKLPDVQVGIEYRVRLNTEDNIPSIGTYHAGYYWGDSAKAVQVAFTMFSDWWRNQQVVLANVRATLPKDVAF